MLFKRNVIDNYDNYFNYYKLFKNRIDNQYITLIGSHSRHIHRNKQTRRSHPTTGSRGI